MQKIEKIELNGHPYQILEINLAKVLTLVQVDSEISLKVVTDVDCPLRTVEVAILDCGVDLDTDLLKYIYLNDIKIRRPHTPLGRYYTMSVFYKVGPVVEGIRGIEF